MKTNLTLTCILLGYTLLTTASSIGEVQKDQAQNTEQIPEIKKTDPLTKAKFEKLTQSPLHIIEDDFIKEFIDEVKLLLSSEIPENTVIWLSTDDTSEPKKIKEDGEELIRIGWSEENPEKNVITAIARSWDIPENFNKINIHLQFRLFKNQLKELENSDGLTTIHRKDIAVDSAVIINLSQKHNKKNQDITEKNAEGDERIMPSHPIETPISISSKETNIQETGWIVTETRKRNLEKKINELLKKIPVYNNIKIIAVGNKKTAVEIKEMNITFE